MLKNIGLQKVLFSIQENVDGGAMNFYAHGLYPSGVYGGVRIEIESTTRNRVRVRNPDDLPWFVLVRQTGANDSVKIIFYAEYPNIEVSAARPYVVLRFQRTAPQIKNYATIRGVGWSESNTIDETLLMPDDVILGRMLFDENGWLLPDVDYSRQIQVDIAEITDSSHGLRVLPTEPPSDQVIVTAKTLQINGTFFEIPQREITVPPVTTHRKDLFYVTLTGDVDFISSSDEIDPADPVLPAKAHPIALLDRPFANSVVDGSRIANMPVSRYLVISSSTGGGGDTGVPLTDSLLVGQTKLIDFIPISEVGIITYSVLATFADSRKTRSFTIEAMLEENTSTMPFKIYAIDGNYMDIPTNIEVDGSYVKLFMTNANTEVLNLRLRRVTNV